MLVLANLILLLISFTNTLPFKAGLLKLLVSLSWKKPGEFNVCIMFTVVYLLATVGMRSWEVWTVNRNCWSNSSPCDVWNNLYFRVCFMVYRCGTEDTLSSPLNIAN